MTRKFDNSSMNTNRNSGPFLHLPENEFALTGIKQLLKAEKNSSQCLYYLHGPAGTGKTHLVRQCLRECLQTDEKLQYRNILASEYAAQYAEATQDKMIQEFRASFENCPFLILEDLTGLQGRKATQNTLVNTIDHILKNGGKCIITCTKMPGELTGMSKRLVNRCHGGILAEVQLPGKKSREKLINQMTYFMQIPIPPSAIKTLSEPLSVSPRELESTLIQLDALARMNKKSINRDFIKSFLAGEISTPVPTLTQITRSVSKQFQVSVKNIRSNSRLKGHVQARQCAMFLMREMTNNSLQKIATYFHRKNHSTVTHGCKKIQQLEKEDVKIKHHLRQIRNSLGVSHQ